MAKLGGKYETIFVVDSTRTDEATAAIVEKFKTLVEQNATLGEVNEWGKRRLAYPCLLYTSRSCGGGALGTSRRISTCALTRAAPCPTGCSWRRRAWCSPCSWPFPRN